MRNIIVDAGPLIALFRLSDRHHRAELDFVARTESDTLVSNLLVIGEVAAKIGANHANLIASLNWIIENIDLDTNTPLDLPPALEIVDRYEDAGSVMRATQHQSRRLGRSRF